MGSEPGNTGKINSKAQIHCAAMGWASMASRMGSIVLPAVIAHLEAGKIRLLHGRVIDLAVMRYTQHV